MMTPPKPFMPEVDFFSEAHLTELFERARELSAGIGLESDNNDLPGQRYVSIITPGRMIAHYPSSPPNTMGADIVRSTEALLSPRPPKYVVGIGFTAPIIKARNKNDAFEVIPFLGFLFGFAYIGHTVVVFEGHPTALAAGLSGADLLLVDYDMVPFLPKGWVSTANQVMRTPTINVYNRNATGNLVQRVVSDADAVRLMQGNAMTHGTYAERAAAKQAQGDLQGAIADISEALRLDSGNVRYYISRGVLYRQLRNFDSALNDFQQALRLDSRNALAYREIGTTQIYLDQFAEAVKTLTKAIQLDPRDYGSFRQRAFAYCNLQEWDRAIADCTESLRLNPKNPDAYNDRATAKRGKKDYNGAIADCTEALRLYPKYHFAYINRAEAKHQKRDDAGARADLDTMHQLIMTLLDQGDIDKRTFDLALAQIFRMHKVLDSSSPDAPAKTAAPDSKFETALQAATEYAQKKDDGRAIKAFSEALKIKPNSITALELRGKAYFRKRDFRKALDDFSKIVELGSTNRARSVGHHLCGLAYEQMKNKEQAIEEFRRAVHADPDYIDAQNSLARMQSNRNNRRRL